MKVNYFHQYESNNYYHIYNHACGDKNLFIDHLDYLDFMAKFQKYFSYVFDIYAYCLMPNHFHFLVKVKVEDNIKGKIIKEPDSVAKENYLSGSSELNAFIEDQYRRFFSAYSIKYNKKHKTSGRLFLNRHKRIILNPEYRLKYMLCYIPVSYTHLRANETVLVLVCRLLLEKKKTDKSTRLIISSDLLRITY